MTPSTIESCKFGLRGPARANKCPKAEWVFSVQRRCVRIWSLCLLFQQFQLGHQDVLIARSVMVQRALWARLTNQNQLVRLQQAPYIKHNSRKTCLGAQRYQRTRSAGELERRWLRPRIRGRPRGTERIRYQISCPQSHRI